MKLKVSYRRQPKFKNSAASILNDFEILMLGLIKHITYGFIEELS